MTSGGLYQTITRWLNISMDGARDNPIYASLLSTPLMLVIKHIHSFSFDLRKFIVACMRVQQPIFENTYLSAELFKIQHSENPHMPMDDDYVPLSTIADWIDRITPFPPTCSVLSFFARAETTLHKDEAIDIELATLSKELSAALFFTPLTQRLDYVSLFHDRVIRPIHPEFGVIGLRTRFLFRRGIQQLKQHYARSGVAPLLPFINERKNLGYATQEFLKERMGRTDSSMNITSADLLRWYMITGEVVYGPLELRIVWRFNDLKPRVYYALGGSAYWAGLYIKEIANQICAILPSTNPFSRFNIQRLDIVGPDQLLVTYDYSSFTTSLSELKSFLFWLGQELKGVYVDVLDVHLGIQSVDLGDLILSYNELVNLHQDVDYRRFSPNNFDTIFQQGRNGSLGVQGNIVFSTVLHGIALGGITDNPDGDSCVGDDALFLILSSAVKMMMLCVNNLGEVHPDKFSTLSRPPSDNPNLRITEAFKYLKRPLSVDFTGRILEGTLDFFPSLADALFPDGDGIHTTKPGRSHVEIIQTFVTQWGRFLELNRMLPPDVDLYEDELSCILALVQSVYDRFGLSFSGQVPGDLILAEKAHDVQELHAWVPPCDNSTVFMTPWMDLLYGRFAGRVVSSTVRVMGEIPPPAACIEGEVFEATSNKILTLLQHLSCVKKEALRIDVVFDEGVLQEVKEQFCGNGGEMVYRYTVLHVPHWYTDAMSYYLPDLVHPDGEESVRDIESIYGLSTIYSE